MDAAATMPLRLVIFTTAELSGYNDALFRRLLADPALEVAAIIPDGFPWRTQPFWKRLKKNGPGYLGFKLRQMLESRWNRWFWDRVDRELPPIRTRPTYDAITRDTGVLIHRTPDLHSAATLEFIRSLGADLGMICGGRIIRESVLTIPRLGTLNIHKRKVPDYRGGGAIGYWELLNGEREIGVTIHYAVAKVDEGAVLAQRSIPIERFDNPRSLQIKATIFGNELYHQVVRQIAAGQATSQPQDISRGTTYRGAGEYAEYSLLQSIRRRQAKAFRQMGRGGDYYTAPSLWPKLLLALPALRRRRAELIAAGQAPVLVLFFHRIANDAANPGTLPFDDFVMIVERLRRHLPIISLDEAARRLASGHNTEPAAVLTFDDGYAADLETSIPWLKYFGIPATWFVSIGNTLESKPYPHDARRGITTARPMTPEELRALPDDTISIGSHCWLHEDCGKLTGDPLRVAIVQSREKLGELLGTPPATFAFPKGIKGVNIKRESWELARDTYDVVCSAYSGYNFPKDGVRHIKRCGNPYSPAGLVPLMLGFTGLGDWRRKNLWTYDTSAELPY
jgi:folate-dependent phosphoribosylglycinamide formyltransferase PurN/peptidoglycan/xylan/chitin deacetylase (PgdA/CDA1 family)